MSNIRNLHSNDEEYTDYSCSTSIERLARDVENFLHKWHVDSGSDRHVSYNSGRVLRSTKILWNLSFYYGYETDNARVNCDFEVELTLWDGPPPLETKENAGSTSSKNNIDKDVSREDEPGLPFSLSRRPISFAFDDFSSLFGIGQHITLTPVNPESFIERDKPLNPSYKMLLEYLTEQAVSRHTREQAPTVVASILTGWLQMALNLAASHCDCQFPCFGIWGRYQPSEPAATRLSSSELIVPVWLRSTRDTVLSDDAVQRRPRRRKVTKRLSSSTPAPPVLSGQLLASQTTFWSCYLKPNQQKHPFSAWADVLQAHCSQDDFKEFVHLWNARHTFIWNKQRPQRSLLWKAIVGEAHVHEWRRAGTRPSSKEVIDLTVEDESCIDSLRLYCEDCENYSLQLLEHAAGASDADPLWGPPDDPVESMRLTLHWHNGKEEEQQPLLTLPLQTRQSLTIEEWEEMEDATESTILDVHRPSLSELVTLYDKNAAHAAQTATQRCVLAALIRTATLPKETLVTHLVDENIIDQWDTSAGNRIASMFAKKSNVDTTTKSLVNAMDWSEASEDMIEQYQAEEIVRKVFESHRGYPNPPESVVAQVIHTNIHSKFNKAWKPLSKAAPPGRLLSLLFVHMAGVRSPSSMALVWTVFCQALRSKWDARESLPNMNYVPGLDLPPKAKRGLSSVGSKAHLAAQFTSEPDPDESYCLIGQKLQVFNLGIEAVVAAERSRRDAEQVEIKKQKLNKATASSSKRLLNGSLLDGLPSVDDMDTDAASQESNRSQMSTEFFDAEEIGCLALLPELDSNRKGARCPVLGATLIANGDQLYAPYLQRPFPLTDDVIAERQFVMARQHGEKASTTIHQKLEIAQRFQRGKLLSDMRSFKAANPGAAFRDFIGWYGNPSDPLADVGDLETHEVHVTANQTTVKKLDKAAEAIQVLERTRDFWAKTWDEADPVAASEQEALFDAESTVEMALDFLEHVHPASLLCQVMAVNLSAAYFALASSAGEAAKIRLVRLTLDRLREKVETALLNLARDATRNFEAAMSSGHGVPVGSPEMMASIDAVHACSKACETLAAAEVTVARAASLLHKLPAHHALVETILKMKEAEPLDLSDVSGRSAFLEAVHDQQRKLPSAGTDLKLKPATREYMLRNMDDNTPCQLCVRYSDDGIKVLGADRGGTVLALTKTARD